MLVTLWKMTSDAVASMAPALSLAAIALLLPLAIILWRSNQTRRHWSYWERDRLRELEAYCWLQLRLPVSGEPRIPSEQAKLICKLIAEMSIYPRVALLLPNAEGELACAGSCGMDDLTRDALRTRCSHLLREGSSDGSKPPRKRKLMKSFPVVLGEREQFDAMPGKGSYRGTIIPLRMQQGSLAGALAVCSPEIRMDRKKMRGSVAPLEILAARLVSILEQNHEQRQLIERLAQLEHLPAATSPIPHPVPEPSTDAGPRLMRLG